MSRGKFWWTAPLLSAFLVGAASAGTVVTCPDNIASPGPIAGLGDMESCGQTVSTGANSVEINVGPSSLIADAPSLETWMGLNGGDLAPTLPFVFKPFGGSAALFPTFVSNPGDLLQFTWSGDFEPEATGFLFYALDNTVTVLDSHEGFFGNMTTMPPSGALAIPQSLSVPLSAGNHTLSFGVIVGSTPIVSCFDSVDIIDPCVVELAEEIIFDPVLSISNLSVVPTAVPEPGTIALFGMGLLGLGALRRKRS